MPVTFSIIVFALVNFAMVSFPFFSMYFAVEIQLMLNYRVFKNLNITFLELLKNICFEEENIRFPLANNLPVWYNKHTVKNKSEEV